MMAKRKLDLPELNVSDICGEAKSAVDHGRIIGLSPIKTSRKDVKYIEAKITDGKQVCRMISFEPKMQKELADMEEKGVSVGIVDCEIKRSRDNQEFELVASKKSTLISYPKKFKITEEFVLESISEKPNKIVQVSAIKEISAFVGNKVTIQGTVVVIEEVKEIKCQGGRCLKKQECELADPSGVCRVVIWEDLVNTMECDESYNISNVSVKEFAGKKYFSTTSCSKVIQVEKGTIGEISTEKVINSGRECFVGDIIGVVSCSLFLSCISCNGKVSQIGSSSLGSCEKCATKQKMVRCKSDN